MSLSILQIVAIVIASLFLGLTVLVVIFAIFSWVGTPAEAVERVRIRRMKKRHEEDMAEQFNTEKVIQYLVEKVEPISRRFYEKNYEHQKEIRMHLSRAGLSDSDSMLWKFLGIQTLCGITGGILAVLSILIFKLGLAGSQLPSTLIIGFLIGGMVGRIVPERVLSSKASQRQEEIRYTLADVVDLMVVCIDAGLGIDATILKVGEETKEMAPELSQELSRLLLEINAGIPRGEAFHNMALRSGVEEVRTFCNMLVQADRLGTSVTDTLRIYSEDNRTKRRQMAEEMANKASTKMTFPLVLFIFPPMLVVLLGPTILSAMENFL